jgi:hypothetical protein
MAEFKLGRIRFVWKDQWGASTTYFVDDVVRYGGKVFICRVGHTADSNFYTDLNFVPTKWEQMSDGQEWRDDWATSTFYNKNDVVRYGGLLYIANTPHTSAADFVLGLETDQAKWDVYAEGFDWKSIWSTATRYKVNDLVRYGGYTYVCNLAHTSAATETDGLELDQAKWDTFNPGIEYKGAWTTGVRYKINDVVKQGANLWVCIVPNTSTSDFIADSALYWETFVEGFEFEDDWSNATTYQPGDVVRYGGNQYVSLSNHTNQNPVTSTANWNLFSEGIRFEGAWDNATAYKIGSVVNVNGYSYLAVADNINSLPPSANWERLNSGLEWQGTWTDANVYRLGDIVKIGTNAHFCVQSHTSEDGVNDPISDTAGLFWNLFSIGTEISVLTTRGDLIYFGGSGPARLPIGREGQVLRSDGTDPEWATLGEIDQVYYVAPHGEDKPVPIWGKTWDKPFASVRYACEQIEKGPRNPNAQYLLELNRVFIQREVTEYITAQIANATPGSIWENFDYNDQKCERDVGFIVDRIIWDIGHGGNLKIRAAAQTLLNVLDEGPFSNEQDGNGTGPYGNLAVEGEQSVEAYIYMKTLLENVLNNEAPAVNYQDENSDLSTAKVSQYINTDLVAEDTAFAETSTLIDVIITALDTQDPATIPERYVPNSTVFVATGQYKEILPIIVPENTVVNGDELRSTNVGVAGSVIDISDSFYTVKTFEHVAEVLDNVVTGATVTPTSGNVETQSQEFPFAETSEALAVEKLVNVMKHQSDFRLGTLHTTFLTDPTPYNGNARKLVSENRQYLQEEVIAFLEVNYPVLRYGKTDTRRDVGYIVDAIIYDLTYGGNALSIQAGLAYFNAADPAQPLIPASIKQATLDAIAFLKTRLAQVAGNSAHTPLQTLIPRFAGTAGQAGDITLINNNLDDIIEIVDDGPAVVGVSVTLVDPTPADGVNTTTALISAYTALETEFSTISAATVAFINSEFPTLVYSESKAARDAEIILKAVGFDFMFNSNYQTIKAAHAYLRDSVSSVYSSKLLKDATRASLDFARSQAVLNVGGNTTAQNRINALMKIVDEIVFGGSNEGNVCQAEARNVYYANLQLERNRDFIVAEVEAYIAATFSDTATATTDTTNVITISDTSWLQRNTAIKFTGTEFGGIRTDRTYFVFDVVSATQFKISNTRFATDEVILTTDTGSIVVSLVYNKELCLRDVGLYIDAVKWDLVYSSNYKSRFVARYYANAVLGSREEDMYYLRNGTGLRNQTVVGLAGDLTPPNEFGTSRVTAGAYASLDPGWGPADFRTWILGRSPYVQNITTFGHAAIGQKIDGALHAGGNDSIVSNDFTQIISDGIGAWVANNGRAELVSVFSYYAHIGYLSTEGGRIRGTNGNNSYGEFGSVAEGFDPTETPNTAIVDNKTQFSATVNRVITNGSALTNFEFENAGIDYTEVTYSITGGGTGFAIEADEFRNGGVFQVRLLDNAPVGEDGMAGGFGYITNSNTAQGGSSTSITLAQTDPQSDTDYIGMKVLLTGGSGVGQFGIITAYNAGTKVASVKRESDDVAGWDHLIPGSAIVNPDGSTAYIVEPALSFNAPPYSSEEPGTSPAEAAYSTLSFLRSTETYLNVTGTSANGTGAAFNIIKRGTKYRVFLASGGTGYERLDTITILGSALGGADTVNDIVITAISVGSVTGAVLRFDFEGVGNGGNFVAPVTGSATAGLWNGGTAWTTTTLPAGSNWTGIASGEDLTEIAAGDIIEGKAYKIKTVADTFFNAENVGAGLNSAGEYFVAGSATPTGDGIVTEVLEVAVAIASGTNTTARSVDGGTTWAAGGNLPSSTTWTSVAYGQGRWVAIASGGTATAYSEDGGATWTAGGALPATADWISIAYGAGVFVAIAEDGTDVARSPDGGETWVGGTGLANSDWNSVAFGNNRFVAVSKTSGTVAAYSLNGIAWSAATLPTTAVWTSITYGQGVFLAVSSTSAAATSEDGIVWTARSIDTSNSVGAAYGDISQQGIFATISSTGTANTSKVLAGARTKARALVADNRIFSVNITEPGSNYATAPTMTIADPSEVFELPHQVRIGNGVLANPSFINRGTQFVASNAEVISSLSDGVADFLQNGIFVAVRRITQRPVPGSNIVFAHLPERTFKLVQVLTFRGDEDGSYTAFYQISPSLTVSESPTEGTGAETRIRYSQVRLTGHDFLDIGTGNFTTTNYPNDPLEGFGALPNNETVENNGGRVFFTATDQDGNFRVGDLFSIEQSTGIATLNADAFNISGLQELNLGNVTLGGGSATVTEFSTDPFFTADSDNIVPTQRAIKAYIASQIGGGGATLNVNKIIAGNIEISGNQILNVTGESIKMKATFEFRKGITGYPLSWNYFLK